ncbi:MAG: hypothetical protein QOG14_3225 [Mycobacterium sp.]|nr:hypothetical protein [Mycobacterium sp.]
MCADADDSACFGNPISASYRLIHHEASGGNSPALALAATSLFAACTSSSTEATRTAASVPRVPTSSVAAPTIIRNGQTLRYAGEQAWSHPVLDQIDPVTVYLSPDGPNEGTASWGAYCDSTPVARVVSQTASAVTVAVAIYAAPLMGPPASKAMCPASVRNSDVSITLQAMLGNRALVDSLDGHQHAVLDPATALKPAFLPAGYSGGQPHWGRDDTATREYTGPGSQLLITIGNRSLDRPINTILEHTSVRGHAATVSVDPGFSQDVLIAWSEDATHAVTVYQTSNYDKHHHALSVAQLKRVAKNLR